MVEPVVILVETMGPANLGAVARTVAAYNLDHFRLVAPKCEMDESTKMWACYGNRILHAVKEFETLEEALVDIDVAVALSRREGKDRHRHYGLPTLMSEVLPQFSSLSKVAYVFGNEESGLNREHLSLCHCSAEIPVRADDGSLNLAHAVTVTLYEVLGRDTDPQQKIVPQNVHEEQASADKIADLLHRCRETLELVGYPRHRSTLGEELVKLQTIAHRAGLENWEVRLLLGMIKQVKYRLNNP